MKAVVDSVLALLVFVLVAASVGLVIGMPVGAFVVGVGLPPAMGYTAWAMVAAIVGFHGARMALEL